MIDIGVIVLAVFTFGGFAIFLGTFHALCTIHKIVEKVIGKYENDAYHKAKQEIDKQYRVAPGLPRAAEHQPPPPGWAEYMTEKAKRESEQRS